jgi:hypothetical protein
MNLPAYLRMRMRIAWIGFITLSICGAASLATASELLQSARIIGSSNDTTPPSIKYENGVVSLIPDLTQVNYYGQIPIYLINATDQPLPDAVSEFYDRCSLEIKRDGVWYTLRYDQGLYCGNSSPLSALEAGMARVVKGPYTPDGDSKGELRYSLSLRGKKIRSAPFTGNYDSKEFLEALYKIGRAASGIIKGLNGEKTLDEIQDPSHIGDFCSLERPEDCLATAELDRCSGIHEGTVLALKRWQHSITTDPGKQLCHTAIRELQAREWSHQLDGTKLFVRCTQALQCPNPKRAPYGSPEKNRALIFRYLTDSDERISEMYTLYREQAPNPPERLQVDSWDVQDSSLLQTITQEAIISMRSLNKAEAIAAYDYLYSIDISESIVPDAQYFQLLESDISLQRDFAISRLSLRGKKEEVTRWLLKHMDQLGQELQHCWENARGSDVALEEWEIPLALECLKRTPYETSSYISSREFSRDDYRHPIYRGIPAALHEPMRAFLRQRTDWATPKTKDKDTFDPRSISRGLGLISRLNDPADDALLMKYLECPWCRSVDQGHGEVSEYYDLRETAADLLKARNHPIPEGIIFEKRIPKAKVPAGG